MSRTRMSALWALATVLCGAGVVLASDLGRTTELTSAEPVAPGKHGTNFGPIETTSGVPFPEDKHGVLVTEERAHIRVPSPASSVGKVLTVKSTINRGSADVVEIGIRRSNFWLDVERVPITNRVLDRLATDSDWHVLRSGDETLLVPTSRTPFPESIAAFVASPPEDGVIGLYGNATLPCASGSGARHHNRGCFTSPFRIADDPSTFRAIYARYVPGNPAETTRTVTMSFPLDRAYQHADRSFDLMVFAARQDDAAPDLRVTALSGTIRPAPVDLSLLLHRARQRIRATIVRQPVSYE